MVDNTLESAGSAQGSPEPESSRSFADVSVSSEGAARQSVGNCGECEDYHPDQRCGVCGRFICGSCHQGIDGQPYFDSGERENLPRDRWTPFCDDECAGNYAERVAEAIYGRRA